MTQKQRVLNYMQEFGSITSFEAFKELDVTRLSAHIWTLRHKDGIEIEETTESSVNRFGEKVYYGRYSLKNREDAL